MNVVDEFLQNNPELLPRLSPSSQAFYLEICASMRHLRSRKAREFFIQTFQRIEELQKSHDIETLLDAAVRLSRSNWALVPPCFAAVKALPDPAARASWTQMALDIAAEDIDAALAFIVQTPQALKAWGLRMCGSGGDRP
jgi:hypothetical protein